MTQPKGAFEFRHSSWTMYGWPLMWMSAPEASVGPNRKLHWSEPSSPSAATQPSPTFGSVMVSQISCDDVLMMESAAGFPLGLLGTVPPDCPPYSSSA